MYKLLILCSLFVCVLGDCKDVLQFCECRNDVNCSCSKEYKFCSECIRIDQNCNCEEEFVCECRDDKERCRLEPLYYLIPTFVIMMIMMCFCIAGDKKKVEKPPEYETLNLIVVEKQET